MRAHLLAMALLPLACMMAWSHGVASASFDVIELEYTFETPSITEGEYASVSIPGLENIGRSGEPSLPSKAVNILLPQGTDVDRISVEGHEVAVEGSYYIEPVQRPSAGTFMQPHPQPNITIYSSDAPFPERHHASNVQTLGGFRLLPLRLYPVRYIPRTGTLLYAETMRIEIILEDAQPSMAEAMEAEDVAEMVENPDAIETYLGGGTLSIPAGTFDYVIITNSTFNATFWELVEWKQTRPGRRLNATTVMVESITTDSDYWCDGTYGDGCGTGSQYNDTQAMIRNFIKDAYQNWGTRYVLLGGDDDVIPHRGAYAYVFPYSDADIPCDMYYGSLDGSWNADNDSYWGEEAGEEADFLAEVSVGRAPVSNVTEAGYFVNKTKAYENATFNNDTYLNKAMFLGAEADASTEGANIKDAITDLAPQFETTKFYNRDYTYETASILAAMNAGTHIINYVGHSSQTIFSSNDGEYITSTHARTRTNTEYFLIYSQGCDAAAFDYTDSVAEHFVKSPGGAFAFIGNSRYGWYYAGRSDGPSDNFDRGFFQALMNGTTGAGDALQESKERLAAYMTVDVNRWVAFEMNLLGDPETKLAVNFTAPTADFDADESHLLMPPEFQGVAQLNGTAAAGTAEGAGFSNYTIEWGLGTSPSEWHTAGINLTDGLSERDGALGTIDTNYASEDLCALRLVTNSPGGSSEDRMIFWNFNYPENKNISECRDLYSDGSNYTLTADVSSNGTCFRMFGSNIHLNCDGHTINYSTGAAGYGIHFQSSGGYATNCVIVEGGDAGSSYGIYHGSSFSSGANSNNSVLTQSAGSYAVYVNGGTFNLTDSLANASAEGTADIYVAQGHMDTVNVTFSDNQIANASSSLAVYWYLEAYANTTGGSAIPGANVTLANTFGSIAWSQLTNSSGMTQPWPLAEYSLSGLTGFVSKANDTGKTYFTNYTLSMNKTGYSSATRATNVTGNTAVQVTLSGLTLDIPQNTTYASSSVALNYTVTDLVGVSSCWYSLDGTANVTLDACGNSVMTGLADGMHNVTLYANDTDGNISSSGAHFSVDTLWPRISIETPANATYGNATYFNVSTDENVSWCGFSLDGAANETLNSTNATFWHGMNASMADGLHSVDAWCNDSGGNVNMTAAHFTADTVPPAVSFSLSSPVSVGASLAYSCLATDNHKGSFSGVVSGVDTSTAGTKIATCTAADDAGNSARATASYTVVSSSGTGGGGGSSAATTPAASGIYIDKIAAGETMTASFGSSAPALESVALTVGSEAKSVEITATTTEERPSGTPEPNVDVYRYAEINATNIAQSMTAAQIFFTVNASWIESMDLDGSWISMYRLSGWMWQRLNTTIVARGPTQIRYMARTVGFSHFMIGAERPLQILCVEGSVRCNSSTLLACTNGTIVATECDGTCINGACVRPAECRPGEKRCIANAAQECSPESLWVEKSACLEGCDGVECKRPTNYTLFFVDISVGLIVVAFTAMYMIKRRHE